MEIKQLADHQTETFDEEYISPDLRPIWERHCAERFGRDESFTLLDVGGGNGVFVDLMLREFPQVQATLLDNSQLLLDRNVPHPRKRLVYGSAGELARHVGEQKFDLICFHWVLHHFIGPTYRRSTEIIHTVLEDAKRHLAPNGRISVWENMYDGWIVDRLPGKIIFQVTSSRFLTPLTRRMGANTAGVGVCFRSRAHWAEHFAEQGLQTVAYADGPDWRRRAIYRWFLHMGRIRCGHFWLKSA